MNKTNFQRIAALLLCLIVLVGSFSVSTFATEPDDEDQNGTLGGGQSLSDIKELLNAISYETYQEQNATVPKATQTITIDATDLDIITKYTLDGDIDADKRVVEYDGIKGLYSSGTGTISWKIEIPEDGRYAMMIEYYPIEGKAAPIERVFKINSKVPFSEARYIKLQKNWINEYQLYDCTGNTALINSGKEAGMTVVEDDGKTYFQCPDVWTQAISEFCQDNGIRFMKTDINQNEIRPSAIQDPKWTTYTVKDSSGYYEDAFEFALQKGENTITFDGENEAMAIKSITFYPCETVMSYAEYMERYGSKGQGSSIIKLEGEFTNTASDKTIYAVEDRSSAANSPSDVTRTVLNTFGGEKWATASQTVTYKFKVDSSGLYDVVTRYRQNVLDGMYVNRAMYLYSEGLDETDDGYYAGLPFDEAKGLVYNYNDNWQTTKMCGSDSDKTYQVYLEAGVEYTMKYEVTLGLMGDIVKKVQDSLDNINDDYLQIIQLTGASPDAYRDYGFSRVLPNVLNNMAYESKNLLAVAGTLEEYAGSKSSNVGTLQKVSDLLQKMATDEDKIAGSLERLKAYIGTLGTFLSDAKTQPLQVDYIMIQPASAKAPKARANFFEAIWHEVCGFVMSFFRDYDSMGATEEMNGESVEAWLATGRDQSQVIRNLINNDFTPNEKISVDLKLVAASSLLPSILADAGPDVYLGLDQGSVINYAIRSAVLPVDQFDDFEETIESFTPSAMLVLGVEDAESEMHYYGLPETQAFTMMFVRLDILADLDLEVPESWDDVMATIPVLQAQNMQVGFTTNYNIFLYQMGGELFADNGMRINLDSKVGLEAFAKTCNMFTMYGFPYTYDAANRFRTGEMPILMGDYTGLYNQLKVFATEIEGLWDFVPMPGVIDENGTLNNCSPSSVTAVVLVKGCEGEQQNRAWEFMKWYTGDSCQEQYSNEMVAIMGPSAKHPTANVNALESLPWTTSEFEQIALQLGAYKATDEEGNPITVVHGENLAAVPNYPGAYILGRYTDFAFLAAYNENADPSQAMLAYINTINKEITRKRLEFGLETLELGQTLASKRLDQAKTVVDEMKNRNLNADLVENAETVLKSGEIEYIDSLANDIKEIIGDDEYDIKVSKGFDASKLSNDELYFVLYECLDDAARALETY